MKMVKRSLRDGSSARWLALTACGGTGAGYDRISQSEAYEFMNTADDCYLIDARTEEELAAGHIPCAIHIHHCIAKILAFFKKYFGIG